MKIFVSILLSLLFCLSASAYDKIAFHCEKDTADINDMLRSPELKDMVPEQRLAFFARKLVGTKSGMKTDILEADTLEYTINVHEMTPLGLLSTCVALAKAYETSSDPNWRDFAEKYESIMFKNGKATDFVSRFLYPSDWIADNIFRGNVEDVTQNFDYLEPRKKEKSIDYISSNKDSFKAFSKPANFDRLRMLEMGFRNHQIPFISNGDLINAKRFKPLAKEGDMFFLLATDFNLDHRELGILTWEGDNLMIIMLAPSGDKVTMEELPFDLYVKRNIKRIKGARIVRIAK